MNLQLHYLVFISNMNVLCDHVLQGRELLMCVNDANVALSHPLGGGLSERTLRTTMEV